MRPTFFDTNILVYTDDASSAGKQKKAVNVLKNHQQAGAVIVSLQVLQEYFVTITRKLKVDAELAQRKIEILSRGRVVKFMEKDVIASIELHRLSRISFWDAMIVQAARISGAEILFSEDFQHGSVVGGVRVVNPFTE